MSAQLTVALDAMGGDWAPHSVVSGMALARRQYPEVAFLVFGDEQQLRPLLDKQRSWQEAITVHHTPESIKSDTKLIRALRRDGRSSMRLAINAVTEGHAKVVVSGGHTGMLMAMAKQCLKTLPGVRRPALASFFPTQRGQSVMLDLGASVECDAEELVQFAIMGALLARSVLANRIDPPTVGLLNIGSEEGKGHAWLKQAAQLLQDVNWPLQFKGFVEGHDIAAGATDVIVTDGFTGNVALKTAEGTARLYSEFLRRAFQSSTLARLSYLLARSAFKNLKNRTDPRKYNGALLLGLEGVCVKSHGGSDAVGFARAVSMAINTVRNHFNDHVREHMPRHCSI